MIINDVLLKRCRERAFYLLKSCDKSEQDIRNSLSDSRYPGEIIDKVILYMKEYSYIDDNRFADYFIRSRILKKSTNIIKMELRRHGVNNDIISISLSKYQGEDMLNNQNTIIKKEFEKKKYDYTQENPKQKSKIINSLMRKGFLYDDIISVYNKEKRENR